MSKRVKCYCSAAGTGDLIVQPAVEWRDGLKVTRIAVHRGRITLCVEWNGRHNVLTLGAKSRSFDR